MIHKLLLAFIVLCAAMQPLTAQKNIQHGEWCAHYGTKAALSLNALDLRSDSVDIQETELVLNITDFANSRISGLATIHFNARIDGVTDLRLDLLSLTVDSVKVPGLGHTWSYDSKNIRILFDQPLVPDQVHEVQVWYRGKPVIDASNWGGFYFQSGYAYNLGVGFDADPHNFGRVWFPCFDNFTERCRFRTTIISPGDKLSFANGILQENTVLPSGQRQRTWVMDDPIPSYLVCVSVGPYTSFERIVPGELNPIPVQIAVTSADTNKLKNSFLHLPEAVAAFEYWYGPYRWDKVGYSMVPFNAGAMEHATNIAYMRSAVDNTLGSETLMAHELSHHWWGDLATCSTAQDMWLNEGWASFSEHLFLEKVYGRDRYIKAVEDNFLEVLETTHVTEGGYRAVSGIPHEITYGSHVYNKGAVVAHNLRGYLGDSLFRTGLRTVMEQTQMEDFSSAELRDKLSAATGADLTPFFDGWVFAPGFSDFTVDSMHVIPFPQGNSQVEVWVKQRLRGATAYHHQVPLELAFLRNSGGPLYRQGMVSGEQTKLVFDFGEAESPNGRIIVNPRSKLMLARAVAEKPITNNILSTSFNPAKADIKLIDPLTDTVFIRLEYHFAMPDTAGIAVPEGYQLTNRFWILDGDIPDQFAGNITFTYDGRQQQDQLDRLLFLATSPKEDSITLLYRRGPGEPWQVHPAYTRSMLGSTMDRWGILRTTKVLKGEYTIAKGPGGVVSAEQPVLEPLTCTVSPNPGSNEIQLVAGAELTSVRIYDLSGRMVQERTNIGQNTCTLEIGHLPPGNYQIVAESEKSLPAVLNWVKI